MNNVDEAERKPLQDEELYLENPQVAKTEDLLKFLPMVIRTLQAYPSDLNTSESIPKLSKSINNKQKDKVNKLRKRISEDNLVNEGNQPTKRIKTKEEPIEEEKVPKKEKDVKLMEDLEEEPPMKVTPPHELDSISKPPLDSIDADIAEIKNMGIHGQGLDKPCLSVKSNDNLIEHFPEDPFQKFDDETHQPKNSYNFNFPPLNNSNNPSFDFSNNNYSDECKDLEQKLLNE